MFHRAIIDHIVINVNSRKRMARFYCEILGFSVEREISSMTQLRLGSILIDLIDFEVENQFPVRNKNIDHFCLSVSPFDCIKIVKHFKLNKVRYEEASKKYGASGYGESLYFYDIEDNKIELKAL